MQHNNQAGTKDSNSVQVTQLSHVALLFRTAQQHDTSQQLDA